MSTLLQIASRAKSLFAAALFVAAVALSGCSADAIMGPEQMEGPSSDAITSSRPHDSQPSNDGCDVGGC